MLAPTPLLRPGPLDISGLFAGSFQALKQRFGLFVLLALFPSVIALVVIGGGAAVMVSAVIASSGSPRGLPALVLVTVVGVFVGIIVTALAQLKAQGMMALAAYEIAQGQRPDFRGLLNRTRGFLPRMAPVIGIAIAAIVVLYALLFGIVVAMVGATDGSSGGRSAALAVGLILLVLLMIPLAVFLQTKLLYTVTAVALEQLGGVEAMTRSWRLTRGAFWRTLGYYLIAALAVGAVNYVVSLIGQLIMMPAMMRADDFGDLTQALRSMLLVIPLYLLVLALQLAVQLFTQPFLHTYVAYMFVDQVRRAELPPEPAGFGPYGQPGYNAPPGQYYGPAGPGMQPPQPWPGQQPPQQPWPGQQPPQHQWPGQQPPQQPWPGQQPPPQQWPGQQQGPQFPPPTS